MFSIISKIKWSEAFVWSLVALLFNTSCSLVLVFVLNSILRFEECNFCAISDSVTFFMQFSLVMYRLRAFPEYSLITPKIRH